MRINLFKWHNFKAAIAVCMAAVMLAFVVPFEVFAEDGSTSLKERNISFTYGYTECTGDVHPASDSDITADESNGAEYPESFAVTMMLCDADHVVKVVGDGVTEDNVTFTSLTPAVLDIDSEGNVSIVKTGTGRIKATVAADGTYAERSIYLDVKADKHESWIDTVRAHYTDRPLAWGLDLDISDGPHQLTLLVRPGAKVRYSVEMDGVVSVDENGVVTPLANGQTQIIFEVDDGGGKYKACTFAELIRVTGEAPPELEERHVWFNYGCTDCTGKVYPCTEDYIGYFESGTTYPQYYSVDMMLCDTDHVVRVAGDGVTADNVTMTSTTPDVLEIDNNGNVTLKKTGKGEIKATIPADETYKECTVYLNVRVDQHDGWVGEMAVYYEGRSPAWGLDLFMADGPQKLVVPLRGGASVKSYTSGNPNVLYVDQNGVATPVSPGTTYIHFEIDGGEKYKDGGFSVFLVVSGEDVLSEQTILGDIGPFAIDWHDGLQLELSAKTSLEYSVVSGQGVSVDQNGFVEFTQKGTAVIKALAAPSGEYKSAEVRISITARDYAEEEAARLVEEEAARIAAEEEAARKAEEERKAAEEKASRKAEKKAAIKAEIKKAKSLGRPAFKAKALNGQRVKLIWGKVKNADGYIVYIKYPGSRKYVKAVKRKSTVKSVTHSGLSRGRVYCYKVRAFKKVKGKTYFGPFSRVRKARVR